MKSARPADFTASQLNLKPKFGEARMNLLPPAPCSREDLSPPAAGEDGTKVVWCLDQVGGGGNGDGAEMKWHRWSQQWREEQRKRLPKTPLEIRLQWLYRVLLMPGMLQKG